MDDSGFLGHFWLLGNGDPSLRRSAISGILLSLRGANDKVSNKDEEKFNDSSAKHQDLVKGQNINSQDLWNFKDYHFSIPKGESESYSKPFFNALEYTMNRLIHGLSSSREAVRQGYAAALTAIFIEFPKAVPLSSIMDAVHFTTIVNKKILPGDQKDLFIGRVFGYLVLQQAGYFKSSACFSKVETVVEDLLEVLDRKSYLQDIVASALASIVIDIDSLNCGIAIKFVVSRLSSIFDASVAQRLKTITAEPSTQQNGKTKPEKTVGIAAPFGLVSLYLKLHQHLAQLSNIQSSPFPIDSKHQSWTPLRRNPLHHSNMMEIVLLTLSHESTMKSLHPKIAAGWNDLFGLLIHSQYPDDRKEVFKDILININNSFFSALPESRSAFSLQKIFYGFRVMLQILVVLKVESLRQFPTKDLEDLLMLYWGTSTGFSRQLLFHCHSSPTTPLQQSAQKCLDFLSQIVHGILPSRLNDSPHVKNRNSSRRLKSSVLDIVNAGVYSSVDLSLIHVPNVNVPNDADDLMNGTNTPSSSSPLNILYTSPIPICEDVWVRGAEAFGKASNFSTLHSGSLVRFANLFFGSLSVEGYSLLIEALFKSSLIVDSNSIQKFLWNFDLLTQLIFFPPLTHSTRSLIPASSIVIQSLSTSLIQFESSKGKSLPDVIGLPIFDSNVEPIPFIAGEQHCAPLSIKKRLLYRLGPPLSHLYNDHLHLIGKLITELTHDDLSTEKFSRNCKSAATSMSQFSVEFIASVVSGLYQILSIESDATFPSIQQISAFFAVDQDEDIETHNSIGRRCTALTPTGKRIHVILRRSHRLTSYDIQTCFMFGSISSHLISKLSQLLISQSETEMSLKTDSIMKLRIILETLISVASFSCLLFVPLLIAGRCSLSSSPTNGDQESSECQSESDSEWSTEGEADCGAALDLMKQLGAICYSEIAAGFGLLTSKKINMQLINFSKISESLEAMADVLPSIILGSSAETPSNLELMPKPKGISETGRAVAQGLTSSILLTLWKSIGRHASTGALDLLIRGTLDMGHENKQEISRQDGSRGDVNEEDKEKEMESDDDVSCDENPVIATTPTTTVDGSSIGEKSAEEDEEDEEAEDAEEIDESQLFEFLLNDKALTPKDGEMYSSDDESNNEYDENMKNPFSRKLKQKRLREKNHLKRMKIQTKFRGFNLIQSSLEGKLLLVLMRLKRKVGDELNEKSVDDGKILIELLLQQLTWIAKLDDELRTSVAKLARKVEKDNKSGIKKQIIKLHMDLSQKLAAVVGQQCNRLMDALSKPKCLKNHIKFLREENVRQVVEGALKSLRELAFSFAKGFTYSSQGSSRHIATQTAKSQELGSLLLLCFGRLEELLLMLDSESMEASVRFKILSSDIKLIIPQYPSQQQSIVLDSSNPILSNCNSAISDSYVLSSSSHLSGESIQSSGLVFTDVITSLVFAWTRRKHLQMTERFLRCLLSQLNRFLPADSPLGLLAIPLVHAALEAPKMFVCRELLVIDSEFRFLALKSMDDNDVDRRLVNTPLGKTISAQLIHWNNELMKSMPKCKEFIEHFPVLCNSASNADGGVSLLLVHQALLGWNTCHQATLALARHRVAMAIEGAKRLAAENPEKDDGSEIEGRRNIEKRHSKVVPENSGVKEEPPSKEGLDQTAIPVCCQYLRIAQRAAKSAFEQQVLLSLKRYAKVFESVLGHSSSVPNLPPSLLTELKSRVEQSKQMSTVKPTRRRKRGRNELSTH